MEATQIVPPDNRILYFYRDREGFRFLSHFHPSPIEIDNELWPEPFWGIGPDGRGLNWAGRVLMEVRELLRR